VRKERKREEKRGWRAFMYLLLCPTPPNQSSKTQFDGLVKIRAKPPLPRFGRGEVMEKKGWRRRLYIKAGRLYHSGQRN
jgi:hypothetical protein